MNNDKQQDDISPKIYKEVPGAGNKPVSTEVPFDNAETDQEAQEKLAQKKEEDKKNEQSKNDTSGEGG
jgi:hypothetical protein